MRHCHSRVVLSPSRAGLSLLEVLVSVAIFLGAMTSIMYALTLGQDAEIAARLRSEAVIRCEAVMGELIAGVSELESSADNPFQDDDTGNWTWTSDVSSEAGNGLLEVRVVVEHRPGGMEPNASFSLVRYVRDPQLFIDVMAGGSQ